MSLFAAVELAPRDPILGLTEQYNADANPLKVNLGAGVYTGENGKVPVLQCVATAQKSLMETLTPKGYLPIDGMPLYDQSIKDLVFGKQSDAVQSGRVCVIQSLGGTGGLKVGADFLKHNFPDAKVLISDPSWPNHRAIFEGAGFSVGTYPYYDAQSRSANFQGMIDMLKLAEPGTIVVLHACCHNPTGYDLTPEQWDEIIVALQINKLIPFLDMAYQGFGLGMEEDSAPVRKMVDAGLSFLLASSFSKTFSLYGERIGALSVVSTNQDEAKRVLSQLKVWIRGNYSTPPTFGAQLVSKVLTTPELYMQWQEELGGMRVRIQSLRCALVTKLTDAGVSQDMSFITAQKGMFSYSGLTKSQMQRLRSEFSIYGMDSGRICVACLNAENIDYVAQSIATVVKG